VNNFFLDLYCLNNIDVNLLINFDIPLMLSSMCN
jgi:hypothetical protein